MREKRNLFYRHSHLRDQGKRQWEGLDLQMFWKQLRSSELCDCPNDSTMFICL